MKFTSDETYISIFSFLCISCVFSNQKFILSNLAPILAYISPGMTKDVLLKFWDVVKPPSQRGTSKPNDSNDLPVTSIELTALFLEGLSKTSSGIVDGETVHPITVEAIKNFIKEVVIPALVDVSFSFALEKAEYQHDAVLWKSADSCMRGLEDQTIASLLTPDEIIADTRSLELPGYGLIVLTSKLIEDGKLLPTALDWLQLRLLHADKANFSFSTARLLCLALPQKSRNLKQSWILGFMDCLQLLQGKERIKSFVNLMLLCTSWAYPEDPLGVSQFFGFCTVMEMFLYSFSNCMCSLSLFSLNEEGKSLRPKVMGKVARLSCECQPLDTTTSGVKRTHQIFFQYLSESIKNSHGL